MRKWFITLCSVGMLSLGASFASASPISTFEIIVNTAPLIPLVGADGPFSLDFQLNGVGPAANSLTISGFNFGGGSASGSATPFGNASGNLTSGVSLNDSGSFTNEIFQAFTPGSVLSFYVSMTTNVNPTPDEFVFAILDGSLFNIPTTGLGDALAVVPIDQPGFTPSHVQTFRGATGTPDYSGVTTQATVPEPASWLLLATGLAGAAIRMSRRRQGGCR